MLSAIIFYLFAAVLVGSAVMVISARNPVHSVLFLILAFFNASGLFVMLGAEFVAMILAIVYVGAVAVLFLFVVMMLDISFEDLRKGAMRIVPLGLITGGVLLAEFIFMFMAHDTVFIAPENRMSPVPEGELAVTNTQALGQILYTDYIFAFQIAGLVLLVAMIGAIVLTHRRRASTLRQKTSEQIARKPEDAMSVEKITSGVGI